MSKTLSLKVESVDVFRQLSDETPLTYKVTASDASGTKLVFSGNVEDFTVAPKIIADGKECPSDPHVNSLPYNEGDVLVISVE